MVSLMGTVADACTGLLLVVVVVAKPTGRLWTRPGGGVETVWDSLSPSSCLLHVDPMPPSERWAQLDTSIEHLGR
jgi:hypothetical protein